MSQPAPKLRRTRAQRYRLVAEIEAMLAGPATYLAVVFAVVLAVELILQAQGSAVAPVLGWIQLAIWAVFVVQFLRGITISPDRLRYLRRNWLTAVSLVIPFLRAFRALRAVRILRATNSAGSCCLATSPAWWRPCCLARHAGRRRHGHHRSSAARASNPDPSRSRCAAPSRRRDRAQPR